MAISTVKLARDLRILVGRPRRRVKEVADTSELTPSQLAVVSRLDREGPATASDLTAAERVRPPGCSAWWPFSVACLVLGARRLPRDEARPGATIDWPGIGLFAVTLVSLLFVMDPPLVLAVAAGRVRWRSRRRTAH